MVPGAWWPTPLTPLDEGGKGGLEETAQTSATRKHPTTQETFTGDTKSRQAHRYRYQDCKRTSLVREPGPMREISKAEGPDAGVHLAKDQVLPVSKAKYRRIGALESSGTGGEAGPGGGCLHLRGELHFQGQAGSLLTPLKLPVTRTQREDRAPESSDHQPGSWTSDAQGSRRLPWELD
ncbi:hypothetical protein NDU88_006393 [Pleurodeles waltl]|uniref:Uncharacterized protein n=1 Tax=Pleurodeles waltl TaxID=8319 RepID=A0AAV7L3J5_PLEWA|nr:hypothetical protein NDU88_006393 [Pleurodeles waltl]